MPLFTPECDWSSHFDAWPETLAPYHRSGERVLEIGAFEGRSTLWLAEWVYRDPLCTGHVLTIDPLTGEGQDDELYRNVDMAEIGRHLFENTHDLRMAGRLTLVVGHSHQVLPRLVGGYSIVYVDGDHTAEGVAGDALLAARLVRPGGVMLFDDYDADDYPGIREQVDYWLAAERATFEVVHRGCQLHARRRA